VLSFKPRALLFRNFAPPEKCDAIVALAEKQLAPSGLALRQGETDETTKDIRTRYIPPQTSAFDSFGKYFKLE
jgi:prolyl 4-hydroxylase